MEPVHTARMRALGAYAKTLIDLMDPDYAQVLGRRMPVTTVTRAVIDVE